MMNVSREVDDMQQRKRKKKNFKIAVAQVVAEGTRSMEVLEVRVTCLLVAM